MSNLGDLKQDKIDELTSEVVKASEEIRILKGIVNGQMSMLEGQKKLLDVMRKTIATMSLLPDKLTPSEPFPSPPVEKPATNFDAWHQSNMVANENRLKKKYGFPADCTIEDILKAMRDEDHREYCRAENLPATTSFDELFDVWRRKNE